MTLTVALKPSPTPAPAEPTDEELVALLRDGAVSAGEMLARRHFMALMRYLQRLVGSDHLAEELHQQTWLSVLDHLDRFDPSNTGGGGFKAWLFRIATNKANDHWRASGREKAAKAGLQQGSRADATSAPHGPMDQAEQMQRLRQAIERLPDNQRQVLMLRYYSNLKFVEIAAVLGCPLNTALGRMHKAMLKLKEMMHD